MVPLLKVYKTLPEWTRDTLPPGFQKAHNTMAGTWAKLTMLSGELKFEALAENGDVQATYVFSPDNPPPLVEPQAWHRVTPMSDDLRCYLEFLCLPEEYYQKKYSLSAPHSEVVGLIDHLGGGVDSGTALDLGCGRGRNALFLSGKGYAVTGFDKNAEAIAKLNSIVASEELCGAITAQAADLEAIQLDGQYDVVLSTVVLQFLNPGVIAGLIAQMQAATKPGGYNLIVAPMTTAEVPCPIDLPFTFEKGQLSGFYDGWTLVKYNEDLGEFHRKDEQGNNLKCHFATLVAQKS